MNNENSVDNSVNSVAIDNSKKPKQLIEKIVHKTDTKVLVAPPFILLNYSFLLNFI